MIRPPPGFTLTDTSFPHTTLFRSCCQPESGWADDYEFPGGDRVRMIRRAGAPIDYSLSGEFLDRKKWYADDVARGVYYVIKDALKAGETVTGLGLDALREGIKVAIADPDERWTADSLSLLGKIEEQSGDERAATAAFHQASSEEQTSELQ